MDMIQYYNYYYYLTLSVSYIMDKVHALGK